VNSVNLSDLIHEADRCVKCGICLPVCPTYQLTQDEGDSPRGRISLIQALANGHLTSADTQYHLDRCLNCLACQSACPSGVQYGELIDGARATGKTGWKKRFTLKLISRQPYRRSSRAGLWLYRSSGLRALFRLIGGKRYQRLDNLIPENAKVGSWANLYPPTTTPQGRVGLFTGCVGRISDRTALDAAIKVLTRLGFEVAIPSDQGCCGALQQHAGESLEAQQMSEINIQAFKRAGLDAILFVASGCGAHLVKQSFDIPVLEITQFLNRCHWPAQIELKPLPHTVGLHTPCSLKHQLKLASEPERLLQRIPGIQLITLQQVDCCGAAGSYLLEQPAMADALRQNAIDKITPMNLQYLATSNSGCALHLAGGLREIVGKPQILQPIELIEMSLSIDA